MEGKRRINVSGTGDATAPGGYANSGIHVGDINLLTGVPVRTRYRQQVQRISASSLIGRDAELAEMREFCTSPETAGSYLWWRGQAWSGKSALMSWFVLHPPAGVRVVSFFVTARLASQDDRSAFIENLLEQLLTLLGEALPPFLTESTREAHLLGLLADAAEACSKRGEQFVLVVDGLDEDRGAHVGLEWHSIASVLPVRPPAGMRVIVSGRPNPPIPADVPPRHPLRHPSIVRVLNPSPQAEAAREEMERELRRLVKGSVAEQDMLGLVVAARGGLSASDLAELTGTSAWAVDEQLRTVAGRTFVQRASHYQHAQASDIYLLAHEELQTAAASMLGFLRINGYRERLHEWAQRYHLQRWPSGTPQYLLRGYFQMLQASNDLTRMIACVTDPFRQDRMLDLSGGDAAALAELMVAGDLLSADQTPDLTAMIRLAMHRDHLIDRNYSIPSKLASAWVRLGRFARAEAIVGAVVEPHRRVALVCEVVQAAASIGDLRRAKELFAAEAAMLKVGKDDEQSSKYLFTLVESAVGAHELEYAERIAGNITVAYFRVRAKAAIAHAELKEGFQARGLEILEGIDKMALTVRNRARKAEALAVVACVAAKAGDFSRAASLISHARVVESRIVRPGQRSTALVEIGRAVGAVGDLEEAYSLIKSATDIALSIEDREQSSIKVAATAEVLAAIGYLQEAESITAEVAVPSRRALALAMVAREAVRAGESKQAFSLIEQCESLAFSVSKPSQQAEVLAFAADVAAIGHDMARAVTLAERAEYVARSVSYPRRRGVALLVVAEASALDGRIEKAVEVVNSIPDPSCRVEALMAIARVVGSRDPAYVKYLIELAEPVARSIPARGPQAAALASIVKAAIAAKDLPIAITIAHSIAHAVHRSAAFAAVVDAEVSNGRLNVAESLVNVISDVIKRAESLISIAVNAVAKKDIVTVERIINGVAQDYLRVRVLASVASEMAKYGEFSKAVEYAAQASDLALLMRQTRGQRQIAWLSIARAWANLSERERCSEAMAYAEKSITALKGRGRKSKAGVLLAHTMAILGDFEAAERAAQQIPAEAKRNEAWLLIAKAAAMSEKFSLAELYVKDISEPCEKANAMVELARIGFAKGSTTWSDGIIARTRSLIESIDDSEKSATILIALAVVQGWPKNIKMTMDALRIARWDQVVKPLVRVDPDVARVVSTEYVNISRN